MSGNALPFIGNCYVYLIVCANIFQITITLNYQISVFEYKYVFEPNRDQYKTCIIVMIIVLSVTT